MTHQLAAMPKYDEYKNSGVEYLPSIPSHWNVQKTKYVAKLYAGLSGKSGNDFSKEPNAGFSIFIPFTSIYGGFTVKPIYQYVSIGKFEIQNKVENGDILFLMSSETFDDIAKCAIFQDGGMNVYLNSFCKGLRIFSSQVDKFFVNYLFKSDYYREYFAQVARGFTRINLKQEYIYNSQLLIPLIQEQITIANFLDKKTAQIDEAITIKQKQIGLLKERKQIIIQKAVTQGLDPDVPLRDSGVDWLEQIPKHWEIRRSKFLFTQRKEKAWKDDIQLSATQAYGVIPQSEYEEKVRRKVVKIQFHLDKRKHVELNDFVISMRSFQGGLERAWARGCIRSSYIILKPLEDIDTDFYSYLLKLPRYIKALQKTASFIRDGQDLNFENFSKVDLFIPPLKEQNEIAMFIVQQTSLTDKAAKLHQQQIEKLKEYKTTLINSAVTGKIKIEGNADDA